MTDSYRRLKLWIPAIAWMLLIFVASTDLMSAEHTSHVIRPLLQWLWSGIPDQTIALVQLAVRKAAHVTEYAVLAGLLTRGLRGHGSWHWKHGLLVICIAACYAGLDEFHQSFVGSRTASAVDLIIDSIGGVIGLISYWLLDTRRREASVQES